MGLPELMATRQGPAGELLPMGCGAVFSFDLKGGRDAGAAFVDALTFLPPGQCRRCQITRHPPGQHHPSPYG